MAVKLLNKLIHFVAFKNIHMRLISHLLLPSSVFLPLSASHVTQSRAKANMYP